VIVELVISFFLLVGAGFALIGSIGLARLPDFYMRLHGPTKATTLGVGGTLIASALYFTFERGETSLHEILVAVFLFITAPVSANLMARAALHLRVRAIAEMPASDQERPQL
jgi:multicomponent K+:H+ antiporter subunit G